MIDDFINRKHGKTKVSYDLPQLKDILEETYGVILYQEQVMQIANRLASFSLGEADILAPRHGQEEKRRDGGAAREVHGGLRDEQDSGEEGRPNFQFDGRVCGLRVQQVALVRVCAAGVSDGVPEDALSRWNSWPRC